MISTKCLTLLVCLTALTVLSTTVLAGGYKQNIAYAGSYTAHRYAFVPEPEFDRLRTPTRSVIPRAIPSQADGTENQPGPVNNRYYYRLNYETKKPISSPTFQIGGNLGTKWPASRFNKNIGKGRELSRIFKP